MLVSDHIASNAGIEDYVQVPKEMMKALKPRVPLLITTSGSDNVNFNLVGTSGRPANIWLGDQMVRIRETVTYTWAASGNTGLDANGAAATLTLATGVWYFYLALNDAKDGFLLYPSQTAPATPEHRFANGDLCHPGASADRYWAYVGFHVMDATTPTFVGFAKIGYTYHFAWGDRSSVATGGTGFAAQDHSALVPAHGPLGLEVGGALETAAGATAITHIACDTSGNGEIQAAALVASCIAWMPFDGINPDASQQVWAKHTGAAGDVHINRIKDVI